MSHDTQFDVIVIGAGHAGVEAAHAAARLDCRVAICTLSKATVALMPCNPAIGGTAKGHLVREIDALGGLMGLAIDATGIQFKVLNRSRGPAVWSPRAQADKRRYSAWVTRALEHEPNIDWILGSASRILSERGRVYGLEMADGARYTCQALVVTTGTFLNGLVHVGQEQRPAGRHGEPPSVALAESVRHFGFEVGRLKTGTPPRLRRSSIDFLAGQARGAFTEEAGDRQPVPLSFMTQQVRNHASCWLLHTNDRVADHVRQNLAQSPLYNGQIRGIGPRYCPSLEDKIMRFPERERHQLYLEPEGLDVEEIYVNGLSMSLPPTVQDKIVRALPGLEDAEILRYGYAVEYDFVQPTELMSSLETRRVGGLFFAGQINGTSGYEEAAAQGLVAGINAARRARKMSPISISRTEAYIGVMVDDLVLKGCVEPYRMFTSRAEHRLLLRIDNADLRLTPMGRDVGLVSDERWARFEARQARHARNLAALERAMVRVPGKGCIPATRALLLPGRSISQLVDNKDINVDFSDSSEAEMLSLETSIKYAGYLRQAAASADRAKREQRRMIPRGFPYAAVPGLSREAVDRLTHVQPETIAQASQVSGVTPAAIAVLRVYLSRLVPELGVQTAT